MSDRIFGTLMIAVALLVLTTAAFFSYEALSDAYGSGPPYYSRTTNMDKWQDPLPEMLAGDLAVAVISGLLVWAGVRKLRLRK